MKTILPLMIAAITLSSAAAKAKTYVCHGDDGTRATLTVYNSRKISWNDESHSASSGGTFIGAVTAPYSDKRGMLQYQLTDFYTTNDSSFVLATSIGLTEGSNTGRVSVYFDNDDHEEGETWFNCRAR